MMGTPYETDVVAWAHEQAELLRGGKLSAIDALRIAEEIEDVGKSEHRALDSHLAVLLAHLLKWKFQASHRGKSWRATIRAQRGEIKLALRKTPSLKHAFDDEEWLTVVWLKAVAQAQKDIELDLPDSWIWSIEQVLHEDFFPE
jgi:hypothetical protein